MCRKIRLWLLCALLLSLALGAPALAAPNDPGTREITITYQGEPIVGSLGAIKLDDQRNKMGVSFACADLRSHVKVEYADAGFTFIVPITARISVRGRTLTPVDGEFHDEEALWYFDTIGTPDTVTFSPYGDDAPENAVTVDAATGLILSPAAASPEREPAAPTAATSYALDTLLEEIGESAKDPWEQAIYNAGAEAVSQDGDTLAFALRPFDPKLKTLPDYAADPEVWRAEFFENVRTYDLPMTLTLADGEPTPASLKSLKSAVTKAASAAKSAFDQKAVRVALAELILPTPIEEGGNASGWGELDGFYHQLVSGNATFEGHNSVKLTPLFYAQSKQALNVKGGPHALVMSCTGAEPVALLEEGRSLAMARLSKIVKANALDDEEIEEAFAQALGEAATAIRKKGGAVQTFTLDIDELAQDIFGSDYTGYMDDYAYEPVLYDLIGAVRALPDAPALDFPKNGRISGSTGGTKVILKAPKDGLARYVQVRASAGDEMAVDLFLRPGGTATVYVKRGMYYLLVASGETWYGMDELFGANGRYSSTAETEILSSKYYHTLTLSAEEGNIPVYGSDPSAFKKQ